MTNRLNRREFVAGTAVATGVVAAGSTALAQSHHAGPAPAGSLAAQPPAGFTPFAAPGRVVRVQRANSLRPGGMFPTQEAATAMVDRAVMELTGQRTVADAWRQLVHPNDRVGVKVNGIGSRNMASNKETVLAIVNGVIAAGVPANQITIYEQWQGFLSATRVDQRAVPAGVRLRVHSNNEVGRDTRVATGATAYAQAMLDCTAVIGVPLAKDHGLCGFTGAMKNMTHGSIRNPQDFHAHLCSPQIAELYAHEAIRSRVRVHVMDAYKVMYDGGPLWRNPNAVVPFESILASTDPIAMDKIGAEIVDRFRTQNHLTTLERRGKPPRYIDQGAQLGLGIADRARIDLREVTLT